MIFVTVGTEYPFDRLIAEIDRLAGSGAFPVPVFAQTGSGAYLPRHFEWVRMLLRADFDRRLHECTAVIAHAGVGTIINCLEIGKPLLVLPRRPRYSEIVSDHQIGTGIRFAERGDILYAPDEHAIEALIPQLLTFHPPGRTRETAALTGDISAFLDGLNQPDCP